MVAQIHELLEDDHIAHRDLGRVLHHQRAVTPFATTSTHTVMNDEAVIERRQCETIVSDHFHLDREVRVQVVLSLLPKAAAAILVSALHNVVGRVTLNLSPLNQTWLA
jgi:predicted transcriptional regulator